MTKNERIRVLKKEFKTLLQKLERLLKTTNRQNSIDDVIDLIQTFYFVYHKVNDCQKLVSKL